MSNFSTKQLESLLLQEEKNSVYQKMIPKSENLEYLKIMDQIKKPLNWNDLSNQMIQFEQNSKFSECQKTKLKLLRLLKSYELADSIEKKNICLDEIKKNYFKTNFSYQRPATFTDNSQGIFISSQKEDVSNLKNELVQKNENFITEFERDQIYKNFSKIEKLEYLEKLDFAILQKPEKMEIQLLKSVINLLLSADWKLASFKNLSRFADNLMDYELKAENPELSSIINSFISKLPLEWIEKHLNNERWCQNEKFVHIILNKKFNFQINSKKLMKLEDLEEMKQFIVSLKTEKLNSEIISINLEILNKQSQKNIFSKELFIEYIKSFSLSSNSELSFNNNNIFSQQQTQKSLKVNNFIKKINISIHNKVVDRFLTHFLSNAENVLEWENLFPLNKLKKLFVETKLLKGEIDQNFENILSEFEVKRLSEKVVFEIKEQNKKYFEKNEKVEIELLLKNVNEVRIKIFQINQLQTLLENLETDFANLDLLGLMAKEDYVYEYDENPLKQWTQKYEFESITNSQRGVFIIDFISAGKTSRAIIKKGHLNLISQKHKLGTSCMIFDEDMKLCTGEESGLYIKKKFYPVNENGIIYLPNNDSSLSGKVLVCHENFVSVSSVKVEEAKFEMSLDVIIHKEQLKVGNEIDVVILPKLKMNHQFCSLQELEEIDLKIEFICENECLKIFEFNKQNKNQVNFKDNQFSLVKVTFPANPISMKVNLAGNIHLHNKNKKYLEEFREFNFVEYTSRKIPQCYFIKDKNKGYMIKTIGMNGEVLKNKHLQLNITLDNVLRSNLDVGLISNEQGESVLGHFPFDYIETGLKESPHLKKSISFSKNKSYFYSQNVYLIKGENLSLPLAKNNRFCFVKSNSNINSDFGSFLDNKEILNDLSENENYLEFYSEQSENERNYNSQQKDFVRLKNFDKGKYFVKCGNNYDEVVCINVFEGNRFESNQRQFIKTKNKILEVQMNTQFVRIKKIDSNIKLLKGKIESQFSNFDNNISKYEAILFGHTFIDQSGLQISQKNNESAFDTLISVCPITKPQNHFLQKKNISDEVLYVLKRRNLEEFIGNTLEKPTILLKRKQNNFTSTENERLKKSENFNKKCKEKVKNQTYMSSLKKSTRSKINLNKIDLSTGFLKNSGTLIKKEVALKDGNILNIESENIINEYNNVSILINLDGQVFLSETLKCEFKEPEKVSMTLKNSKTKGYVYKKSRMCQSVLSNQNIVLDNIDKTTFKVINSLTDIFNLIPILYSECKNQLNEWRFLTNWKYLSSKEKLIKYDKFISHELNLFCYFKDKEFYKDVILPHISNKREKTIIDWFLLGDKKQLSQFLSIGVFHNELTTLEKVLILLTFWNKKEGKQLAEGFKLEMENISSKINDQKRKRLYDQIIESKDNDENFSEKSESDEDFIEEEDIKSSESIENVPINESPEEGLFANKSSNLNNINPFDQNPQSQYLFSAPKPNNFGFGSSANQQGNLFGNTQNINNNTNLGGLFGGPPNINNNTNMGNLFGSTQNINNTNMGGLFGGPPNINNNSQNNPFGHANNTQSSLFAQANNLPIQRNNNAFGNRNNNNNTQNNLFGQPRSNFSNDNEFKKAAQQTPDKSESTTEYIEKKFHFLKNKITKNIFYSNLIENISEPTKLNKNFLDKNFVHCFSSPTEIIFIMALLDLEFENKKLSQSLSGLSLTLTAQNNCLVFSKQVIEIEGEKVNRDMLISQRFFDPDDRFIYQKDGTKTEKPVREFKKGRVYGSRVILINSSVSEQKVEVITEIPEGSLPIQRSSSLLSLPFTVSSFRSQVQDFYFYFPENGNFKIFPATVAKDKQIFAFADFPDDFMFQVGEQKKCENFETLNDILSSNKIENVLEYLKTKNLKSHQDFHFSKIGWLLSKDKSVYEQIINIYEQRGLYEEDLWKFAFKYYDHERVLDLFKKSLNISSFSYFQVLNIIKKDWEVKDYFPLINSRAHSLNNQKSNILNKDFKQTYKSLLNFLLEKSFFTDLDGDDYILLISYLLLQDRINEAFNLLESKNELISKTCSCKIQKDYIEAYIDFMVGFPDFSKSKEICQKYLSYPIITWRNRFVEIANQLTEYENEDFENELRQIDKTLPENKKYNKIEHSVYLEAEIDSNLSSIKCSFKNVDKLILEYYMIDLEILFSQDPFEESLNDSLTKVLPFFTKTIEVKKDLNFASLVTKIESNLTNQNLLIRVIADSQTSKILKYIPFRLKTLLNESHGFLKVFDQKTKKPVPKVYVKCFCKDSSNSVKFYKDGYTDLRGSFDYVSININKSHDPKKFKLMIASKEYGCKILDAKLPTVLLSQNEGKAKKIFSKSWKMKSQNSTNKNIYKKTAAFW